MWLSQSLPHWARLLRYIPALGPVKPRASASQSGATVTFRLTGIPPEAPVSIHVLHSGQAPRELEAIRSADRRSALATMAYSGGQPAQSIRYLWEAGGQQVEKCFVCAHPDYPFRWKQTQVGSLEIFYAAPMLDVPLGEWAEVYQWMAGHLGLPDAPQQIFLMPDLWDVSRGTGQELEGQLQGPTRAVITSTDLLPSRLTRVVVHELAHALLYNQNPIFWEEGVAVWMETQERCRQGKARPVRTLSRAERRLSHLPQEMERRALDPLKVRLGDKSPRDPYAVGLSFLLFVRSRLGEEGAVQLIRLASRAPLAQAVGEMMGGGLAEAFAGWRAYVQSDQFRRDVAGLQTG